MFLLFMNEKKPNNSCKLREPPIYSLDSEWEFDIIIFSNFFIKNRKDLVMNQEVEKKTLHINTVNKFRKKTIFLSSLATPHKQLTNYTRRTFMVLLKDIQLP